MVPSRLLGLEEGDAHVIRNAGGVVTTTRSARWRSQAPARHRGDHLIHTPTAECHVPRRRFKQAIQDETPGSSRNGPPSRSATSDTDVRQSLARIQASPFIPHKDAVRGFVYEVETGKLREVV